MRVLASVLVVVRLPGTQLAGFRDVEPAGGNTLEENHNQQEHGQCSQLQPETGRLLS
jgi:hypothetical protein